jgi:NADH-quinone oxidoreductase subunit C
MSNAVAPLSPLEDLAMHVTQAMGGTVESYVVAFGELTLVAKADQIVPLMTFLRDNPRCQFTTLVDLCGADYPERVQRFDVVYHLLSMRKNQRIRVKIALDEATPAQSAIGVFPAAAWYEREAFDMYGILFAGNPDLRRLLTDYGFQGFPLRKDFPLTGHVEVRYDPDQARVVYEPVRLPQAYRNFDFLSPWEGMNEVLPGDEKAPAAEPKK